MHSIFEKNKVAIDFTDTHREKSLTPKSHCYAVIINANGHCLTATPILGIYISL